MYIHFDDKAVQNIIALILEELPEVGAICRIGSYAHDVKIKNVEPFPYTVPQSAQENYRYSIWRITFNVIDINEEKSVFVAIHEKEAEEI